MSPPRAKPTVPGTASPSSAGLVEPGVPRRPPPPEPSREDSAWPRPTFASHRRKPALPRRAGRAAADAELLDPARLLRKAKK